MEDSVIDGNALLNAAAVWFILKAIEVLTFVVYDGYSAVSKWLRNRANPDPGPHEDRYDRRRGWIEYVLSGTGFLNLGLCRQRKLLLLLTSTIIPVAVFVLELMSITLGNESRTCVTSTDPNVVSSPSLVLFGAGRRHANLSTTLKQAGFGTPRIASRPCISWPSTHAGVDFLSSICADGTSLSSQAFMSTRFPTPSGEIALLVPRRSVLGNQGDYVFPLLASKLKSKNSLEGRILLGAVQFVSEVIVNGKNFLYQNATLTLEITEKQRNQVVKDVRIYERIQKLFPSTYIENELIFGFAWSGPNRYIHGAKALVLAVLSQATREPTKTAAKMSFLNTADSLTSGVDISCAEDFRLPRTASIVIIVVAVIFRLILISIPSSKSSVEHALEKSEVDLVQSKGTNS